MSLTDNFTWDEIARKFIKQTQIGGGLIKASDTKDFYKWFMTKKYLKRISFDFHVYYVAWKVQNYLKKEYDYVTVVDGVEGEGKTTWAVNFCALVSDDFKLVNICFGIDDFLKNLRNCKPGQTILVDEGANVLFSRFSSDMINKTLVKIITQVRKKSQNIVICIPNFHIIDSYFREHRVKLLVRILKRGYYKAIYGKGIKRVNQIGKARKLVSEISLRSGTFFHGRFNKDFPNTILREDYEKKKDRYINEAIDQAIFEASEKSMFFSAGRAAKASGISKHMLIERVKEGVLKGKMIGGKWYIERESLQNLIKL